MTRKHRSVRLTNLFVGDFSDSIEVTIEPIDFHKRLREWTSDPATIPFDNHLREHGCTQRDIPPGSPGGFGYCDEAMALFSKMRPENKVLIG